ncbi:MAG TPA: hypothetical protein VK980_12655 [Sphingomonas sp.]|nr:hypothetical protein [Sphingomonas sp.]
MAEIAPYIAGLLVAIALTLTVFEIGEIRVSRTLTYVAMATMALDAIGGHVTAPVSQYWADWFGIIALSWAGIMLVALMARGLTRVVADRRSLDVRR